MQGKITILCGFPASGKSTYANSEPEAGNMDIVLCPDDFRKEITGLDFFQPAEDIVWATVKTTARVLARKRSVLIDGTHLTVSNRFQWINMSRLLNVPIECVWVSTPFDECVKRNAARERKVPQDVMERMRDTFVPPSYLEGFEKIIEVTSKKNGEIVETILENTTPYQYSIDVIEEQG